MSITHEPIAPKPDDFDSSNDPSVLWAQYDAGQTGQASIADESKTDASTPGLGNAAEQTPPPAERGNQPAEAASEPTPNHRTRNRIMAAGVAAAAALGIMAGVLASKGGNSHEATGPAPKSPAASASPFPGKSSSSESPSASQSPSTSESAPADNGNEYSAGTLDPTVPVAVPYVEGQALTKADVEKLVHNVDVAITTGNMDMLLYSGILPTSDRAQSLQASQLVIFNSEKNPNPDLIHYWQTQLYDKDVWVDPADPSHVQILTRSGSDFDFQYPSDRIKFTKWDFHVDHAPVTLPNGQTEDILRMSGDTVVTPSNATEWSDGFSS